jgi:hypothetical protein
MAPYVKTPVHVDYGTNLKIGQSTFINRYCCILDTPVDSVEIGDRCLIGPNFSIYAVSHPKGTSRQRMGWISAFRAFFRIGPSLARSRARLSWCTLRANWQFPRRCHWQDADFMHR